VSPIAASCERWAGHRAPAWTSAADAIHCQRATAAAIVAAGVDYLLTRKANQAGLLHAVMARLSGTDAEWAQRAHDHVNRGHGRTEQRTVRVAAATGIDFPHAAQVFRTVRHTGGLDGQRTGKQVVYGITSLTPDAAGPAEIAFYQRGHWSIENRTHHVRDTTFDEDHSQIRTGHAPQNLAALRNPGHRHPPRDRSRQRRPRPPPPHPPLQPHTRPVRAVITSRTNWDRQPTCRALWTGPSCMAERTLDMSAVQTWWGSGLHGGKEE
jgi:predicted transposase YbfD/YdcC